MKRQELYLTYRPRDLDEVHGQSNAVATLEGMLTNGGLPRALLLAGPSGTGKTTLARILRRRLQCGDLDALDIDCAAIEEPIGVARSLKDFMFTQPLTSRVRVCILEEVQSWSRAKFAQQALLRALEDMPEWAYFVLCTTEPTKIIPAILTRCTEVKLAPLDSGSLQEVVSEVARKEKLRLDGDVLARLLEAADGSARRALVLLAKIRELRSPEEQLEAITRSDAVSFGKDLAFLLLYKNPSWAEVAKVLGTLEDEPEEVRRVILGFCRGAMLNKPKMADRAFLLFESMRYNFYDTGAAGLVAACYEFLQGK